jgi:predicted RNase H-like HicB family nuclease
LSRDLGEPIFYPFRTRPRRTRCDAAPLGGKGSAEYWFDGGRYVGRLKEVPSVFSQGETRQELEENIQEAYQLMLEEEEPGPHTEVQTKDIGLEV